VPQGRVNPRWTSDTFGYYLNESSYAGMHRAGVLTESHQQRTTRHMSLTPKNGTVYVVDDDEAVRDSLQWLLEGKGYKVTCFDSAEAFLSHYDPLEVACLIADIRMDGITGR